jgi:putative phosphoesterase
MRVAALYDIHGNLPALETVLHEVRQARVDQIVVGGDIFPGPMSRECLDYLSDLDLPIEFIRGNCEDDVLAQMSGTEGRDMPERFREIFRWSAAQLSPEYRQVLASWPLTLQLSVDGLGEVLFCHATPRDINQIFTRETAEDRLLPVFEGIGANVVVCGHTHMQFDRRVGSIRVVNAGSLGTPYGEAGAHWLLLGPEVQLQRTKYNIAQAAEFIRGTTYPAAETYAQDIVQPPPEAEKLELYGKWELR